MSAITGEEVRITPERFLAVWGVNDVVPDARFGLLNGLETGLVLVKSWNGEEVTQDGLEAFADFLIGQTQQKPRTRLHVKAWQVLLKLLITPQPWQVDKLAVYQRAFQALCQDEDFLNEGARKQPIAGLIDQALNAFIKSSSTKSVVALEQWREAVVATGRMELISYDVEQRDAFQLLLAIRLAAYVRQLRLRFPDRQWGFSSVVKPDPTDELAWRRERRYCWAETLLMLLAERGDFDGVIKL